jgi:hypothetical protein
MQTPSLVQHSAPPPPGEVCAVCGRVIGGLEQPFIWEQNIVCFGCHRDLSQGAAKADELSGVTQERVFFNDARVQISRSQVTVDRTVYPVADIRFVRLARTTPRRAYVFVASVIGVVTSVFGLNRHLDRIDVVILIVGAVLFGAGLTTAIARRTKYSVLIDIGGAEFSLLSTTKARYATTIVNAIGEAIVERGQYVAEAPPQLGLPPGLRTELQA